MIYEVSEWFLLNKYVKIYWNWFIIYSIMSLKIVEVIILFSVIKKVRYNLFVLDVSPLMGWHLIIGVFYFDFKMIAKTMMINKISTNIIANIIKYSKPLMLN